MDLQTHVQVGYVELEAIAEALDEAAVPAELQQVRIAAEELSLQGGLASGSFGDVFRASYLGAPVAVRARRCIAACELQRREGAG